ncbi:Protease precursor, partial [hydrothermal vent metagenome]
ERLLKNNRVFSESCFDDLDIATPVKNPPVPAVENSLSPFGEDNERNIVLNGPVITCGAVKGESYIVIYSASGVPIQTISKGQLVENPHLIVEALTKAANSSLGSLKLSKSIWNKSYDTKSTFSDFNEDEIIPNDPFFKVIKKKKNKLLGIVGSNKKPKVSIGSIIRMGNKELGGGNARMDNVQKAEAGIIDQWGIQRVGYLPKGDPNSAWNVYEGNHKNVLIAIIDSGLDFDHPDGPQYIWTNLDEIPNNGIDDDGNGYIDDIHGWNFYQNSNDLTDIKGHGTLVAGIIAAKTNNGIGISGINSGAVIMPLKVVDGRAGITRSIHIFQAIHYAVNKGAQIINISLGGKGISKLEQNAINYAYANGVFVVVASGNNGNYLPNIGPAAAQRVMSVGSLDFDGTRSTITSWGPNNGLIAPGELIVSLQSKDAYQEGGRVMSDLSYYRMSGSSFSAPMVVATASLLLAGNPDLTPTQLEDILMGTATDMGRPGWDGQTGSGLLNAKKALENYKDEFLTVKVTDFKINIDKKKKLKSVDVYGTIRGDVESFIVEVGKGRRAKKFKKVAGPFKVESDHNWITQIVKDDIRGSKEWIVRIKATSKKGEIE